MCAASSLATGPRSGGRAGTRAWRGVPGWLAVASLVGCTGGAVGRERPVSVVAAPLPSTESAGWLLPLELEDGDGSKASSRQRLVAGLRLEAGPGGWQRATERLPSSVLRSLALPAHLGGGVLFWSGEAESQFWRADGWLGTLQPLAALPVAVTDLRPWFDGVWLLDGEQRELGVLKLDGQWDLRPAVPPGPLHMDVRVMDGLVGALSTPLEGVWVTSDAGRHWRSIGVRGEAQPLGDALGWLSEEGCLRLRRDGELETSGDSCRVLREPGGTVGEVGTGGDQLGHSGRSRRAAVLRGLPWGDGRTVGVIDGGRFLRIDLATGSEQLLRELDQVRGECHAVPWGNGGAFVCGARGSWQLWVWEGGSRLSLEVLPLAAVVRSNGAGALLLDRGCGGEEGAECLLWPTMRWTRRRSDTHELTVAGDPGEAWVLRVAQTTGPVLEHWRRGQAPEVRSLRGLGGEKGRWLPEGWWNGDGTVGFWRQLGERLEGVRVAATGVVERGPARPWAELLWTGRRALRLRFDGGLEESLDGGQRWGAVGAIGDWGALSRLQLVPRGCAWAGCVLGEQLRMGWGAGEPQALASEPPRLAAPRAATRSGRFECMLEAGDGTSGKGAEREPWRPVVPTGALVAEEDGRGGIVARAVANQFRWRFHVVEPWGGRGFWSTAEAVAPLAPGEEMGALLGIAAAGTVPVFWRFRAATGQAAAMVIRRTRAVERGWFLREGRAPLELQGALPSSLSSFVGAAGAWYGLERTAERLVVWRLEGAGFTPWLELEGWPRALSEPPQLVSDGRGRLAVLLRTHGEVGRAATWWLYPLTLDERGEASWGPVEVYDWGESSMVPRRLCDAAVGWQVEASPPLSWPAYWGDQDASRSTVFRLRLEGGRACFERLAVEVEAFPPATSPLSRPAAAPPIPVNVVDAHGAWRSGHCFVQ